MYVRLTASDQANKAEIIPFEPVGVMPEWKKFFRARREVFLPRKILVRGLFFAF